MRRLDTTQGRSDRANGGQADRPVYLDYNATTPVDPRVVDESLPFLSDVFANPASEHRAGRHARAAVEAARARIAAALGAQPGDVIFTSGATESINLALKGVVSRGAPRRKIVTFSTEHKAVLDTCAWLVGEGVSVDVLPVDRDGLPDLDVARDRIDNRTMLVSVMAANNETGVINPIQQISSMARQVGALVHCDATQAFGKVPFVIDAAVDLVSVSSHKIYGPWGSETRIRSRRGAVVLVDEPAEQIPSANVARTNQHRVRRFGSWRGEAEGAMGSPAVVVLDIGPERPIEMPPTSG